MLNNQFGSDNPWENYLRSLEELKPAVETIAVTDYYVAETYEEFIEQKDAGRLPGGQLIFPKIRITVSYRRAKEPSLAAVRDFSLSRFS